MLQTYYTIRALASEWQERIAGCEIVDAFSQVRNELTLVFEYKDGVRGAIGGGGRGADGDRGAEGDRAHGAKRGGGKDEKTHGCMLRCSVDPSFIYIFRTEGTSKKKRNVATLFKRASGRQVQQVRTAERDRMLYIDFAGGGCFQYQLFGSRANVFLVDSEGRVEEAFRSNDKYAGEAPPWPRSAPLVGSFEDFESRWKSGRSTLAKAVRSAFPLFDQTLAEETVYRASRSEGASFGDNAPEDCTRDDRRRLFESGAAVAREVDISRRDAADADVPGPRIYSSNGQFETFSLIPLQSWEDSEVTRDRRITGGSFESADPAVRVFVWHSLAQRHFASLYNPLEKALADAHEHYSGSLEEMKKALEEPGSADRYERYGHLLMATPQDVPDGADEVTLPDLFTDQESTTIPLDPALSAVENAQKYYDKARRSRRSREEAEGRLDATERQAQESGELLERLRAIEELRELKDFRKEEEERLARYAGSDDEDIDRIPFRRFPLSSGYEVWVGRNARQNDELTFRHAQKYDYWMHARGVPGSHAVLRLPNRDAQPDKYILHQAAAIAAYYSKARGQSAAPVMIARRKHVRSPKGGAPGAVYVEHEDVVMVEPRKPDFPG